jgi:uncharacterized protein YggT (Ycf19 family)
MAMGPGFMTEAPSEGAAPAPDPPTAGEEKQLAGYRIRDPRAPEQREVQQTARKRERRRGVSERVYLLVDYLFVILYGLLAIRFLLGIAAANEQAGFVTFIRAITQPFFGPFADIVPSPPLGPGIFDVPVVICMAAYLLLHVAVRGLLRITLGPRRPANEQA